MYFIGIGLVLHCVVFYFVVLVQYLHCIGLGIGIGIGDGIGDGIGVGVGVGIGFGSGDVIGTGIGIGIGICVGIDVGIGIGVGGCVLIGYWSGIVLYCIVFVCVFTFAFVC